MSKIVHTSLAAAAFALASQTAGAVLITPVTTPTPEWNNGKLTGATGVNANGHSYHLQLPNGTTPHAANPAMNLSQAQSLNAQIVKVLNTAFPTPDFNAFDKVVGCGFSNTNTASECSFMTPYDSDGNGTADMVDILYVENKILPPGFNPELLQKTL